MTSSTPHTRSHVLLLLDLPPKTFVGIDLISFNSSPKFHGIFNLPKDIHCLYTGTDASLSVRHCHWLKFEAHLPQLQVQVLKWSHDTESLHLLDPLSESASTATRNIATLKDRGSVDYQALLDAHADLKAKEDATTPSVSPLSTAVWLTLCQHLTESTLNRILGSSHSATRAWTISSISSAPGDMETIPGLSTEEASRVLNDHQASEINFVPINLKQTWPEDSIGRDRTEKARDRSWYLGHLISSLSQTDEDRKTGASELLGELQFCFVMVLTLANYSCLEQWKRILSVVFTCKSALSEVEGFFVEAFKVLHAQLQRIEDVEGALFEMSDEGGSAWLRTLLKTFRENVDELPNEHATESKLNTTLSNLEDWLRDTYGWEHAKGLLRRGMVDLEDGERVEVQMDGVDEDEETGEFAPVVIEL